MKSKSKQAKQSVQQKALNLDLSWQKITDMETSLRRLTTSHAVLPINHDTLQVLLKFARQVLRIAQSLKSQQKHYQNIQQNNNMIQSKLINHDSIINSLQQHHMQRLKSLSDEIKNSKQHYEKAKKNMQESEEQARNLYQTFKKQNQQLKFRVTLLIKQKEQLEGQLKIKDLLINELREHKERFQKIISQLKQIQPKINQPKLQNLLCSSLSSKIISYLYPSDIVSLQLLNKQSRIYLLKSKQVQKSLYNSIIKVKDRRIAYYHKHIDYFQKLYHKIPEQILQTTFYRYQILKQSIGSQILNILNSAANLFQGKFQDFDDEQFRSEKQESQKSNTVRIGGLNVNIDKQINNIKQFNLENPHNILQIDQDIVRQFLQDRKNSKQKVVQQISYMYSKIKTTAQIYSIDVESIGKFITMVLINFSKVFVLSKNLYAQARNLQSLNTIILAELARWDKMKVQKNSLIQDLKAQLEAQKKLKIFFTNQSMKSEQRALFQQNLRLSIQAKLSKQTQKLDAMCKQKDDLSIKLSECQKDVKNLKSDNRQIRKAYESGKQKYNKIIQQLSVVKQSILRMNIV